MSTLFVLGNINEHTFGNSIVAANNKSLTLFGKPLQDIYVLHTHESNKHLNSVTNWINHLNENGIKADIITHRIIDISAETAVVKFAKYVERAVATSEKHQIIVDLTNSTTFNKSLLSTVAYILDLRHVYMIDIGKLNASEKPFGFIPAETLDTAYINAPETTALDSIAYLSLTEVLRYKQIIEIQTNQ